MTFKKHPGIWFCLFAIETSFILGIIIAAADLTDWIANSIVFFWFSMMFYGLVYYHGKFIDSQFRKESKDGRR